MSTMPRQKPGKSKQDYGTPPEFLRAVKRRLNIDAFAADIAADDHNAVADCYFTKSDSALLAPTWNFDPEGWNWLNPPFSHIAPWVARAYAEGQKGVRTAVLIPAGVGSNWWRDSVHHKAQALFLNGRITFLGTPVNPKTGKVDAYPKDCALLSYPPVENQPYYDVWKWNVE